MVKDKEKKNMTWSRKIYENKNSNKYKERILSSKFPEIVLKIILFIIFYNSISLSEEKSFKLRK